MFKYLIKIILPPLFAFFAFALFVKYTPSFRSVNGMQDLGEYTTEGLIAYYKLFAPGQIAIALITQWLIMMPLWKKILGNHKAAIPIFLIMLLICLLTAFGLAYIIWDPATPQSSFIKIGLFMTGVQAFYWIVNFLTLYLLDVKAFNANKPVTEPEI
ncbi:hypothetical protein [Mucilaginibacter antarcticus]|uniref:Tic20 family protein n=1 Tax=Mucilaginibacter antarcticus TaxID=1855725 RepID=A0ABW5XV06_9SPHI